MMRNFSGFQRNTFRLARGPSKWRIGSHFHRQRLFSGTVLYHSPRQLLEDKFRYYAVIEIAMHRLTVATRYYISRACKEARVDLEALLVSMGKPREFSTYGMLNWVHYWEMYEQTVTSLRMTEEEQDMLRRTVLTASTPPELEGYLLLNLKPMVGIHLLRYLRAHPDLKDSVEARAMYIDARLFGLKVVYWVELWMFSRQENFEELCRDARKAAANWSSLEQAYSGGYHHLMELVEKTSQYDHPEATYKSKVRKEILEEVIPAGNRVALAGGLDELSLVSLYKFQLEQLYR